MFLKSAKLFRLSALQINVDPCNAEDKTFIILFFGVVCADKMRDAGELRCRGLQNEAPPHQFCSKFACTAPKNACFWSSRFFLFFFSLFIVQARCLGALRAPHTYFRRHFRMAIFASTNNALQHNMFYDLKKICTERCTALPELCVTPTRAKTKCSELFVFLCV